MFRQLSDKDCAATVVAHATGLPYTRVVNAMPEFRYMRDRHRNLREKADQIVGRSKRTTTRRAEIDGKITRNDREFGTVLYNMTYRVSRHPYFCHFGLCDEDYLGLLDEIGRLYVHKKGCTLAMLRHVPFAMLSLPSLNVKNSAHMVLWRDGRIWDPSPKKRYDYLKLRRVKWITAVALARDAAEFDRLRKVLRTNLHGAEIVTMLIWKVMEHVKQETPQEIRVKEIGTWWESGQLAPPEIENIIMEHTKAT